MTVQIGHSPHRILGVVGMPHGIASRDELSCDIRVAGSETINPSDRIAIDATARSGSGSIAFARGHRRAAKTRTTREHDETTKQQRTPRGRSSATRVIERFENSLTRREAVQG